MGGGLRSFDESASETVRGFGAYLGGSGGTPMQ